MIDAVINKYGFSECKLALQHLGALACVDYLTNSIITFDRGYPSQELFHEMDCRGFKFVIRAAASFKITNKLTAPDSL